MSFTHTQAVNDAMLVGIVGALDADPVNPAYAVFYDGSAVALVTMVFARPAAQLVAHELVLAQGDPSGDMIMVQGNAASFELYNGTGVFLGSGDVSDALGTGTLKISGTDGTLLYAGARVILDQLKFA